MILDEIGVYSHNPTNGSGLWPEEAELLMKLVEGKKHILEIGRNNGASTILLAQNAKVVSVDPVTSPWLNINLNRARINPENVRLIEDYSDNLAKYLTDEKFDAVFIDGFHSFKQVVTDFEVSLPYMDKCTVIFHDCSPMLQKDKYRPDILEFALKNYDDLMNDDRENFFIDEAVMYLTNKYNLTHIDCEIECFHPRETGLTYFVRGTTSPHSAIGAAIYERN